MHGRTITITWGAGLCLAALIYLVGPDDALTSLFEAADRTGAAIQSFVATLGGRAFDFMRALAISCFAVYFVLSVVANGRGLMARWQMPVVSVLFLLLVWHEGPEATGHWLLAFVLASVAALHVTRRLGAQAGVT